MLDSRELLRRFRPVARSSNRCRGRRAGENSVSGSWRDTLATEGKSRWIVKGKENLGGEMFYSSGSDAEQSDCFSRLE